MKNECNWCNNHWNLAHSTPITCTSDKFITSDEVLKTLFYPPPTQVQWLSVLSLFQLSSPTVLQILSNLSHHLLSVITDHQNNATSSCWLHNFKTFEKIQALAVWNGSFSNHKNEANCLTWLLLQWKTRQPPVNMWLSGHQQVSAMITGRFQQVPACTGSRRGLNCLHTITLHAWHNTEDAEFILD